MTARKPDRMRGPGGCEIAGNRPMTSEAATLGACDVGGLRPQLEAAGNATVMTVPLGTLSLMETEAPCNWAACLTMARPNPLPPVSLLRLSSTR